MPNIKVLHIIGSLGLGGAEVLTLDVARNASKDFELHVGFFSEGSQFRNFERTDVILVQFKKGLLYLNYMLSLYRYIKRERIQIVHLHSVVNPIPVVLAAYFTKAKVLLNVHGYSLNKRQIKKLIFYRSKRIAFVSNSLKKTYEEQCRANNVKKKFIVLYNGIDPSKFIKKSYSDHLHAKQCAVLGMIGNFNNVRDQLTVCKALKILNDKFIDFRFLFVGSSHIPELFSQCYEYCKQHGLLNKVEFTGSRSDVPQILAELDFFVYASHHDTFGIAVVEAMMSGTPVIVNDLDVFKEITDNGNYAKLYSSGNIEDLANAILDQINNPEEAAKKAELAKEWAQKNYSIQSHIKNLANIYREMLP